MTEKSQLNPQIATEFSPLSILTRDALIEFGDFSPGTMGGVGQLMFIRFANRLIEQLRQHPYWPPENHLDYYVSIEDTRPIPDIIMIEGLKWLYSRQQKSAAAQDNAASFVHTMNQTLWNRLNGNTKIQMRVVDGGSNPHYAQSKTSTINGLPYDPAEE